MTGNNGIQLGPGGIKTLLGGWARVRVLNAQAEEPSIGKKENS